MTKKDTRPHGSGTGSKGPDDAAKPTTTAAGRWLRIFVLALFGAVLASSLMLPWKVLGLVLSLCAVGVGVVALVKAVGAGFPRIAVLATGLGLAAALFLSVGTGAAVLLWPVTQTYEDCMSRALTLQAQGECQDGLRKLEGFGTAD